jgi:hypothetical protein
VLFLKKGEYPNIMIPNGNSIHKQDLPSYHLRLKRPIKGIKNVMAQFL